MPDTTTFKEKELKTTKDSLTSGQDTFDSYLAAEQQQTPGLTQDAAIGNVLMQQQQAQADKNKKALEAGIADIPPGENAPGTTPPGTTPPGTTPPDIDRPVIDLSGGGTSFFEEPVMPDREEILKQERERAQAMIDATNALFQSNLADIRIRGQADLQQSQSIGVGAGLAGSPFAAAQDAPVIAATAKEKQAETARRQAEIARLMGNADIKAENRFLQERQFAASERLNYVEEQQANRENFLSTLKQAAQQGISYSDFTEEQKTQAKEKSSMDDFGLEVFMNANKPKPEQKDISYTQIGNKVIGYYTDFDENGNPSIKSFESEALFELPPEAEGIEYDTQMMDDGTLLMIPKVFDKTKPISEQIVQYGGQGEFGKPEQQDIETIGNVKDGVYERQPDGSWKEVIAPQGGDSISGDNRSTIDYYNEVMDTQDAIDSGLPPGSTFGDLQAKKEKEIISITDDFAFASEGELERLQSILDNPAMDEIVGPNRFARIPLPFHQGERNQVLSELERFVNKEVINELSAAKARGATFGALSDAELELLKKSANVISSWIKEDKFGNKYVEQDEKIFIAEINKMKDELNRQIARGYGYKDQQELISEFEASGGSQENKSLSEMAQELRDKPQETSAFSQDEVDILLRENPNLTSEELLDLLGGTTDFTSDLSMSENGSQLSNGQTNNAFGKGYVTSIDGSSYWKHGLDYQLNKNGKTKGAMVRSPFSGKVVEVFYGNKNETNEPLPASQGKKQNKGFGNQVKIRLDDGREIWVSHLENVAKIAIGDSISKNQIIGTQGNTGMTGGITGVHLDITMKKPNGNYYTAREVAVLLGDNRIKQNKSFA